MLFTFVVVSMGAALVWLYVREKRIVAARRAAVLDDCASLFGPERALRLQGDGYPVLSGRYRDRPAILCSTVDTLTMRKLPSLWLEVSVHTPVPYSARLSYLLRPVNTEFFSPSSRLSQRLEIPADWPREPAMLRVDGDGRPPPLEVVGPHIKRLCADRRVKEIVITPRGVRIVYLADEAERGSYMLLRQARFDQARVTPALAGSLLDAALGLAADLAASAAPPLSSETVRTVRMPGRKGCHESDSIALQG